MGTEKDLARGNRDDWKPSNAFWQQSQIAVRTDPRLTGERIEPKTTWLSERQRKRKEKQSKTFQPIPAHLSSKEAIEAYVGAMRKPVPTDEAALKLKEEKTSKKKTDGKSTGSPTLVASESSTPSGGDRKKQEEKNPSKSVNPPTTESAATKADKLEAEKLLDRGQVEEAVTTLDQAMTQDFMVRHGKEVKKNNQASVQQMQKRLLDADKKAGTKSAVVYMHLREKQGLDLIVVTASGKPVHKYVDIGREDFQKTAKQFSKLVADPTKLDETKYLRSSQSAYANLITPVEKALQSQSIDNLMLVMDKDLQTIPVAALNNPETGKFLMEQFSLSSSPSFAATNTDYKPLKGSPVRAMGASEFKDSAKLPYVKEELNKITFMTGDKSDDGKVSLNSQFNLDNLKKSTEPIIHVATHGAVNTGVPSGSYLSTSQDKITLKDVQNIQWKVAPELLVISGCQSALGAEKVPPYAFSGASVASGAKSSLGALWSIADNGTMALMTEFYRQLQRPGATKAQALQRTQQAMLESSSRKSVYFDKDGFLHLGNGQSVKINDPAIVEDLEEQIKNQNGYSQDKEKNDKNNFILRHPYFWSGYTLVGDPF
jgi:CHAT domain-containing protein